MRISMKLSESSKDQSDKQVELKDAQNIIELLKHKVQVLSECSIEQEKKLCRFARVEPVLNILIERFDFKTPESAIEYIDKIKSREHELFEEVASSQLRVAQLENKISVVQKEQKEKQIQSHADMFESLQKYQRDLDEAKGSMFNLEQTLNIATQKLQLWTNATVELRLLYQRCSGQKLADFYDLSQNNKNEQNNNADQEIEDQQYFEDGEEQKSSDKLTKLKQKNQVHKSILPNPDDMNQIIRALSIYIEQHNEALSSKRVQEYTGIANSLWMKHFKDDESLKFSPKVVFQKVSDHLERLNSKIHLMNVQMKKKDFELNEQKQIAERYNIFNKALVARIRELEEKLRDKSKERINAGVARGIAATKIKQGIANGSIVMKRPQSASNIISRNSVNKQSTNLGNTISQQRIRSAHIQQSGQQSPFFVTQGDALNDNKQVQLQKQSSDKLIITPALSSIQQQLFNDVNYSFLPPPPLGLITVPHSTIDLQIQSKKQLIDAHRLHYQENDIIQERENAIKETMKNRMQERDQLVQQLNSAQPSSITFNQNQIPLMPKLTLNSPFISSRNHQYSEYSSPKTKNSPFWQASGTSSPLPTFLRRKNDTTPTIEQ
ncbi:MAG: hypothetical protein EZS28_015288, partial [Streblomastix strix]